MSGGILNNLVTPRVGLQTDLTLFAQVKKTWIIVRTGSGVRGVCCIVLSFLRTFENVHSEQCFSKVMFDLST